MILSPFPPVPVAPARQPSGEASEGRFSMEGDRAELPPLQQGRCSQPQGETSDPCCIGSLGTFGMWDLGLPFPQGARKLWAHVGRVEMALGMITSEFSKHWVVQLVIEIGDIKCFKNDHFTFLVPFYCVFIRKIKGQYPGRTLHCQSWALQGSISSYLLLSVLSPAEIHVRDSK